METIFLGVLGGLVVLSIGIHALTLWKFAQYPDVSKLNKEVSSLRLEVTDVVDRLDTWQRRDRTRAIRAAKEEEAPPLLSIPHDRKAAIRARHRANLGG